MNYSLYKNGARTFVLSLLALASMAHAGALQKYEVDADPDDLVGSHVEASFIHHAEAASGWYLDATRGMDISDVDFEAFARRFRTGTFAEFQYIYMRNGVENAHVYHASSGRAEPDLGVRGATTHRPYAEYFDPGAYETHAEAVRTTASWVTSRPLDDGRHPGARNNDAELKIAQTIERDILSGEVTRGGRLLGFVSQPMCASCEPAVQALADAYDMDVSVTALARGSRAYQRFDQKRRAYLRAVRAISRGNAGIRHFAPEVPGGTSEQPPGTCGTLVPVN